MTQALFEKRKKNRKKKNTSGGDYATPLHEEAEAANDVAMADCGKGSFVPPEPGRYYVDNAYADNVATGHRTVNNPVQSGIRHLDFQQVKPSAGYDVTNNGAGPGDFGRWPVNVHVDSYDQANAAGVPNLGNGKPSGNPTRTPNAPDGGWGRDYTGTNALPSEKPRARPERAANNAQPNSGTRTGVAVNLKNRDILAAAYKEAGVRSLDYRGQ